MEQKINNDTCTYEAIEYYFFNIKPKYYNLYIPPSSPSLSPISPKPFLPSPQLTPPPLTPPPPLSLPNYSSNDDVP